MRQSARSPRGKISPIAIRTRSFHRRHPGNRTYLSTDVEYKGDNNRFRLIWWRTIIDETIDGDPWFGLGFGHDLAAGFVRRYYPDSDEEFSARSPHCIFITLFGRTGVIGLLAFLAIVAAMTRRTWAVLRAPHCDEDLVTLWLAPWIVLISACFGVVLEGPMGAVVFWTTLGMAAGYPRPVSPMEAADGIRATDTTDSPPVLLRPSSTPQTVASLLSFTPDRGELGG